ncbi:glycosyltransferase family 2 protein [Virgibacillus doumboii]|uniref:glycosyltransferase family 2 protein n=1 Tax=Virgibacillus doumboii TaxID=2697503 RepID=UPI0013E07F50|nr:glycosyltransferase [Virgibacillus doumboii]
MFPKISIILPVYNVEQYIDKCINSILTQTFQGFELIIVNDGSTDGTGKVCNGYAERDNRIKVMHTKNNGQASARNLGLHHAKGNFIGFVDGDDWIEKDMFKLLHDSCRVEESDMAVIGVREVNEEGDCLGSYIPGELNLQEILKRAYPCNKLIRRELFYKNDLFFVEGRFYEDLELIPKLLIMCERRSVVNEISYNYLKRKNSTTSSRDDRILDNLWAYTEIKKFLLEEGLYSIHKKDFEMGVLHFKRYYINILYDYPTKFLCKNTRKLINDFSKIGGFGALNYFKLTIRHFNYKIRKIGHFYKKRLLN